MIRLSRCAIPDCVLLESDNCRGVLTIDELRQLRDPCMVRDITTLIDDLEFNEHNGPDTIPCAAEGKA